MSMTEILEERDEAIARLEEDLEKAEDRADEMQRLVYVVYTAFAEHMPDVAEQLKASEPYLAEEFE